jgi:hypothetical protein
MAINYVKGTMMERDVATCCKVLPKQMSRITDNSTRRYTLILTEILNLIAKGTHRFLVKEKCV